MNADYINDCPEQREPEHRPGIVEVVRLCPIHRKGPVQRGKSWRRVGEGTRIHHGFEEGALVQMSVLHCTLLDTLQRHVGIPHGPRGIRSVAVI